ncbi:MAG: ATP-binding protein [Prevotella sp.]|nr:ATP-binding protein [Alistipes senegalensis]MCM1358068.1 ATP-binding protein [Prevotella sp.]MCM1473426.1 ATP-binding protein [Muribaculaceae bacterium]
MNEKIEKLALKRDSIAIFYGIGDNPVISGLYYLLDSYCGDINEFIRYYAYTVNSLYKSGYVNLSEYILKIILEMDNFYIKKYADSDEIPTEMTDCLINELKFFQELSELTPEDFLSELDYSGFMPRWKNSQVDIVGSYLERLKLVHRYGYGQYAEYKMFIFKDSKITPVKYPDTQRLDHLYGYKRERQAVIDNTLALLDGKPAQNVLLYGDAGTGKSSSVKAIVNEYADKGLRLIEITKEQLRDIPQIIDDISHNPLKFIIFIDDLTFNSGEDCFGSLKAMLEGSASARSDNIVIYATSNRRHLVKETFSEREGDDVHRNDTMQELISLSARFGLRVNFSRPDKKEFIRIAGELAKQKGLSLDENEFELKAERFVMTSGNGRSPRTAKQFVNQLINEK